MKVEIKLYTTVEDESIVMQKISTLTKQAKELGFDIGELEFKHSKHHKEKEDNEEEDNSEKERD
jgi:hypothetical protein